MLIPNQSLDEICFFCGNEINGKSSKEHIFPEHLLKRFRLKEKCCSVNNSTQYSRLKVKTHSKCNNEFGSAYEGKFIKIMDSLMKDDEALEALHLHPDDPAYHVMDLSALSIYRPSTDDFRQIVSTWLIKLYYGVLWYQATYYEKSKIFNKSFNETRDLLISKFNEYPFQLMQKSYQNGYGFNLPSSLYCIRIELDVPFSWGMMIELDILWIKLDKLLFMIAINDGNQLDLCSKSLEEQFFLSSDASPFRFFWPLSIFIAASKIQRMHYPPKYILSEAHDCVANHSMLTLSNKHREFDHEELFALTLDSFKLLHHTFLIKK